MKKKRVFAAVFVLAAVLMFGCGKGNKVNPEEIQDATLVLCDDVSITMGAASEDAVKEYVEAKEKDEQKKARKKAKKKKKEQGDADDPANSDSTAEYGKQRSPEAMKKEYIGKWEQQGTLSGGGELDGATAGDMTCRFKSDMTYSLKGRDVNGKKVNDSGKWKLNANNQLEAGDYTFGIDESGYLLMDTGERDGKGMKIKFAFAKI